MSIPKKLIGLFFQFDFLSGKKKEKCQSVRFTKKGEMSISSKRNVKNKN